MKKDNDKNIDKTPVFSSPFLAGFSCHDIDIPFSEHDLREAEAKLAGYEHRNIDWELAKALKFRSNLLASFAISKAEGSALTLKEAEGVYNLSLSGRSKAEYERIKEKIASGQEVAKGDYERLEYVNMASTFQSFEEKGIKVKDLSPSLILKLHESLTGGLDIFSGHLADFEPYDAGKWRANDLTRVGDYRPAPYGDITRSLEELIAWFQACPSAANLAVFHAALYAIHPFRNGNKRVCRTLEHFLLQDIGYDKKQLYSPSYYYYQHHDRYYKYLIESLDKHDFGPFAAFASEALFFSIVGVIVGVLEKKKLAFIKSSGLEKEVIKVLKPLTKRKNAKFSRLLALNKRKVSRQTFANYLAEATGAGILRKEEAGRNAFYSINVDYPEETLISDFLKQAKEKLGFLPNDIISYL